MFEGMAADELQAVIDLVIEKFRYSAEGIKNQNPADIGQIIVGKLVHHEYQHD